MAQNTTQAAVCRLVWRREGGSQGYLVTEETREEDVEEQGRWRAERGAGGARPCESGHWGKGMNTFQKVSVGRSQSEKKTC